MKLWPDGAHTHSHSADTDGQKHESARREQGHGETLVGENARARRHRHTQNEHGVSTPTYFGVQQYFWFDRCNLNGPKGFAFQADGWIKEASGERDDHQPAEGEIDIENPQAANDVKFLQRLKMPKLSRYTTTSAPISNNWVHCAVVRKKSCRSRRTRA